MASYRSLRIECEKLSPSHCGELLDYAISNMEHLAAWEPLRAASWLEPDVFEQSFLKQLAEQEQGRALRLVLRETAGEKIVGTVNFTNICPEPFAACNLGYSLAAASQGTGLMGEGLAIALRCIFEEHGMHRVMANYIPRNERSAAVLRRLGFSVEGYARAYLRIAGRWEDHVLTSLIGEDAKKMSWWTPGA